MKKWIKPLIITEELEIKTLLGENGWYTASQDMRYIAAISNDGPIRPPSSGGGSTTTPKIPKGAE